MSPVEKDHGAGLNGAVAAVLRGEKAASDFTNDQLSERSGIPVVSLQRFLTGKRAIDVAVLEAICDGLGISPREVVEAAQHRLEREAERYGIQTQAARREGQDGSSDA